MIEAVVVGGGIAGSAAALALRERGALVTVVEGERPGAGATGASAGMLAPQYEVGDPGPLFEWGLEARGRWKGFADRVSRLADEELDVARPGMLVANPSAEATERARRAAAWQRDRGLRAEVLAPAGATELQPGLSPAAHSFLWLPDEGLVDAQNLPSLLERALDGADVRMLVGNAVAAVRSRAGSVAGVVMEDGRGLDADRVVLAAGAWSAAIDGLPHPLPVRPVKGQMLRYGTVEPPLRRIVSTHDGAYVVPRPGGSVLAGSTMEESGYGRAISEEARKSITGRLGGALSLLEGREPREQWAGLRPVTEDGRPIVGPDPDLAGLLYATGYGRNGILLGPLCGETVAAVATGGEPELDLHAFRPDRFPRGTG